MVLEFSKSVVHKPCNEKKSKYSQHELKQIMLRLMQENGVDTSQVHVSRDGLIELNGMPNLKMHTVLLEAEKLGLSMRLTRKTLIEVC